MKIDAFNEINFTALYQPLFVVITYRFHFDYHLSSNAYQAEN